MPHAIERRAHRRLSLTLGARMLSGAQYHRTEILDLSQGGFLLAPLELSSPAVGDRVLVEAVLIGKVEVEVVALSHLGIHVKIQDANPEFDGSLRRLIVLAKTWCE